MDAAFETLVRGASARPLTGWDWSAMRARMAQEALPWSYETEATSLLREVKSVLDLDTGGGELLASLAPFPAKAFATERYAPNVPIAQALLEPLGVTVVDPGDLAGLPFPDHSFDLVLNRHGSLEAEEVYRVLTPGGTLLTQQVGSHNLAELNDALGAPVTATTWDLDAACDELEAAGFAVDERREVFATTTFKDIGAVVFYLNAIPWQIEGFSLAEYSDALGSLHRQIEAAGGFIAGAHRFLISASRRSPA